MDFDDAEVRRQYDPLMSPLVWDLAHIGQQEELWLLRGGDPDRPGLLSPQVDQLYDAFVHSRASQGRPAAAAARRRARILRDRTQQGTRRSGRTARRTPRQRSPSGW